MSTLHDALNYLLSSIESIHNHCLLLVLYVCSICLLGGRLFPNVESVFLAVMGRKGKEWENSGELGMSSATSLRYTIPIVIYGER